MRAYLTINAKNKIIPLDHRDQLIQIIHHWLGWTSELENHPPYSFSRFESARNTIEGIIFNGETSFFFSSPDALLVKKLEVGVKSKPELFNGLMVTEIKLVEDPDLSKRELFYAAAPLLLIHQKQNKTDYILYNQSNANAILKEQTIVQLKAAGINDETFDVTFDENYTNAGIKKIIYNNTTMRASWCQIIIKGEPNTKRYLWHTGLGNLTEIGFGTIM
jgi:CRISPR-associated endoribonuclease Cas6